MKKTILIMMAVLGIAFTSCEKEKLNPADELEVLGSTTEKEYISGYNGYLTVIHIKSKLTPMVDVLNPCGCVEPIRAKNRLQGINGKPHEFYYFSFSNKNPDKSPYQVFVDNGLRSLLYTVDGYNKTKKPDNGDY